MKNIYSYKDYRKFLNDYYQYQKQSTQGFTYARFAEKANLKSPNYLKLIINGDRKLTISNIHSFGKAINIQGQELDYFEALVLHNQSETKQEKSYYSRRLKAIKQNSNNKQVDRKSPGKAPQKSSRIALKLYSEGKTKDEILLLANQELQLSEREILDSLNYLEESGQLVLNSEGIYSLNSKHLMKSDVKGINESQRVFLKEGLIENQIIFDERYSKGTAKFLSTLFTAKSGNLPYIFADLREAFEAIAQKYEPESSKEVGVYRGQIQLYRFKNNKS